MTDMRVNRTGATKTGVIKTGAIKTASVESRPARKATPRSGHRAADPYDFPTPPRFLPALLLVRMARVLAARWQRWRSARRTQAALERLDEAGLRDIGLSRGYFGYEPDDGLSRRERLRIRRLGSDFGLWRHGLD
ncbi:DUF1127 domain-containing protein [Stappia sp. WLB 29]|uniref:DUF1127 domain-containing protein n=1 Tax=Stappia sp. WLB 29 TaxID=2925220 RepID=UPI0020C0B63A|nr:DUF1127 domain-containing protein [Stappia sp. WLB 29]